MTRRYSLSYAQDNLTEIVRQMDKGDLWEAIQKWRAEQDFEKVNFDDVFDNVRDKSPGREIEL